MTKHKTMAKIETMDKEITSLVSITKTVSCREMSVISIEADDKAQNNNTYNPSLFTKKLHI